MPEMILTAARIINLISADESGLTSRKLDARNKKGFRVNL